MVIKLTNVQPIPNTKIMSRLRPDSFDTIINASVDYDINDDVSLRMDYEAPMDPPEWIVICTLSTVVICLIVLFIYFAVGRKHVTSN